MGKGSKVDETEQERALAEIAAQRFNRYREVFAPLEDQYIQQVFDVRNQSNYETAGGIAAAQFQKEFQTGQDKLTDQMFQQGVDPSSGAFQENSAALRRAQAVGQGLGVSGAKVANTDRFYQGLRGVMAIGQGQSADAIEGMAGLARQSGERATASAESAFNRSSAVRSGVAAGLGYAATPFVDSKMKKPSSSSPAFSGTTNTTGRI
jgi:hypothetical protein